MAQDEYEKTQELITRLESFVEKTEARGEDPGYMPELAERLRRHQEERTMTE